jgi:hypothetical protein
MLWHRGDVPRARDALLAGAGAARARGLGGHEVARRRPRGGRSVDVGPAGDAALDGGEEAVASSRPPGQPGCRGPAGIEWRRGTSTPGWVTARAALLGDDAWTLRPGPGESVTLPCHDETEGALAEVSLPATVIRTPGAVILNWGPDAARRFRAMPASSATRARPGALSVSERSRWRERPLYVRGNARTVR